MSIINLPIINSENEKEFRNIFLEEYVNKDIKIEGYNLKIFVEDFEHVCYEYAEGHEYKKKFSLRRARKLLMIREICNNKIPYILIHQIFRENKSVCILCEPIEFAVFLVPKASSQDNYFRLGTIIAYGKQVETKIEKQKNAGCIINSLKEVFK